MSNTHDVGKMVDIYKKLFLLLTVVTAAGIGVAFLHMPVWLAVMFALVIIAFKSKIVLDSFKHLLTGRQLIVMVFGLTAIFALGLLVLPVLNHHGYIVGTEDISKELQMQEKPAQGHHHGD